MKKIFFVLILIPVIAFAESLVYVAKTPTPAVNKMQGPSAYVEVAGVKINQPIAVSTDDGKGAPVWAVLVKDADLAKINKDASYLGKGLNEVKAKDRAIFDKLTTKAVTLDNGSRVTLPNNAVVPPGATVQKADQPIHTFFGFDPLTGTKK